MTQTSTSSLPVRSIWTLIGVDVFARISYGLARTPALPLFAACLGATPPQVGLVGAAATLTGVVLKLPAGAISDVVGRRPILLGGLFVFCTGPLLYFLAAGAWALVGIRLYHGLATALFGPVAMAAVAALAADRRGEYLSWLSNSKICGKLLGAFGGGLILWLAAGGLSSTEAFQAAVGGASLESAHLTLGDFHLVYGVCAVFGALALALGLTVLRRVDPASDPEAPRRTFRDAWLKFSRGIKETASDVRVLLASGAEGVQNLTVGVIEHFLPVYVVLVAGRSALEAGLLYAAQMLTTILAKPLFGRFSDRRGRRAPIILGMALCVLPFVAIPWVTGFAPLFALALVFGLGEALVTSSAAAYVGDLCQERSLGAAMGVFGTIKDTGHALGPILGGVLIALFARSPTAALTRDHAPAFQAAFAIVGAVLVLYTVIFLLVRDRKRDG